MERLPVILLIVLLGGCSTASSITKIINSKSKFDDAVFKGKTTIINNEVDDTDAYRIFHQASTGFVSIQSIRQSSEARAETFCKRKGMNMEALKERTSVPPHVLGNFPRIEIIFVCTETKQISTRNDSHKYDELKKLKSLLDDGAITEDEYNAEKKKLLKI